MSNQTTTSHPQAEWAYDRYIEAAGENTTLADLDLWWKKTAPEARKVLAGSPFYGRMMTFIFDRGLEIQAVATMKRAQR